MCVSFQNLYTSDIVNCIHCNDMKYQLHFYVDLL